MKDGRRLKDGRGPGVKSRLVAAVVTVALVAGCAQGAETRGSESKEALVEAYLTALQAGDSNAMLSLVKPGVEAQVEVADAIRKDGGRPLRDVAVSYLDEFGGVYVVATANATSVGDGSGLQVTIPMSRDNGRYYLALGQAPPTGNEADIVSPVAQSVSTTPSAQPSLPDPSRWNGDPRLASCTAVDQPPEIRILTVYELAHASDYRGRLPTASRLRCFD